MIRKIILLLSAALLFSSCIIIDKPFWEDDDKETVSKNSGNDSKADEDKADESKNEESKSDESKGDEDGTVSIVVELDSDGYGKCPYEIKQRVFHYAELYLKADTVYKYGGQDPLRSIAIDCSGLVIMCYTYALEGTGYELILPDMGSSYMK